MLHYVHSSVIYSSQKLETNQMSLSRGVDTENVVHLHNDFMKFTGKWMELQNIILSEVTQSQKTKSKKTKRRKPKKKKPKQINKNTTTAKPHSLISGY
jgi:DNA-binding protein H-NS